MAGSSPGLASALRADAPRVPGRGLLIFIRRWAIWMATARVCRTCAGAFTPQPGADTRVLCPRCASQDAGVQLRADQRAKTLTARSARRRVRGAFRVRRDADDPTTLQAVAIVNGRLVYQWGVA